MITLKCTNRTVDTKTKLKQSAAPGKNFFVSSPVFIFSGQQLEQSIQEWTK